MWRTSSCSSLTNLASSCRLPCSLSITFTVSWRIFSCSFFNLQNIHKVVTLSIGSGRSEQNVFYLVFLKNPHLHSNFLQLNWPPPVKWYTSMITLVPQKEHYEIMVLIAQATSEGLGEPAHPRSLARAFAFC